MGKGFLFDASSLIYLLKLRKLKPLNNNYIQWLTIYEATNALWKESSLIGSISIDEAYEMVKILSNIIEVMKILSPHSYEHEILETAGKLEITVYDASYIVLADKSDLVLITEDAELREKARNITEAISVNDMLQ